MIRVLLLGALKETGRPNGRPVRGEVGELGRIRTCDLGITEPPLYPAELRARKPVQTAFSVRPALNKAGRIAYWNPTIWTSMLKAERIALLFAIPLLSTIDDRELPLADLVGCQSVRWRNGKRRIQAADGPNRISIFAGF